MRLLRLFFAFIVWTIASFTLGCQSSSLQKQEEIEDRLGNWAKEIDDVDYLKLLESHIKS